MVERYCKVTIGYNPKFATPSSSTAGERPPNHVKLQTLPPGSLEQPEMQKVVWLWKGCAQRDAPDAHAAVDPLQVLRRQRR